MPGIYGDLRNNAMNMDFDVWNGGTLTTTSGADFADLWTLGPGSGSTISAQKDTTHQSLGSTCAAITYTHAAVSELHQVAALVGNFKGRVVSASFNVATATASAVYPYISSDGGTTKTYGQPHSGAGATAYEVLKVEGFSVPAAATALWFGLEYRRTCLTYIDSAGLVWGPRAETDFLPNAAMTPAWTVTYATANRAVDGNGTATTLIVQAFATLLKDLKLAGYLQ